jgi:hypothetical protein
VSPHADEVFIEDIAAALSKICRYGGHCTRFYSVAEHSVLVSKVVPSEHALQGLLHDATEAYLVDIPRPIKAYLTNYKEIEALNWKAVAERFGVPYEFYQSVKEADNSVLLAEKQQVMLPSPEEWNVPGEAAHVFVMGWSPQVAEQLFLNRFRELTEGA